MQERREKQAEAAGKREEKRNKAYLPPKESTEKSLEVTSKKKAQPSLDLDALKAKVNKVKKGKQAQRGK